MVYDDLIIGSGLTALAVAYGLDLSSKVCVLAGLSKPNIRFYDNVSRTPCANTGFGGLGAYWHGVIPMGQPSAFFDADRALFEEFFAHFYSDPIEAYYGMPWLFVPYQPIRPAFHWKRLCSERKGLEIRHVEAHSIEQSDGLWSARVDGVRYRARRIWIAAGVLGTPTLLQNSPGLFGSARSHVSDHVILYLGQLDRVIHVDVPQPTVVRKASGVWMQNVSGYSDAGLVTVKPARFSYSTLDHGIEQRSAFGLPTAGLLGKLCSAGSLGLISESLFNKFGLFPNAGRLNVYAQIRIGDAYRWAPSSNGLLPEELRIQEVIHNFRSSLHWPELDFSLRPELFIRGIHLHHSLDMIFLNRSGLLSEKSLTIADTSDVIDIGPEHHSFKAMVRAYSIAKATRL